MNESHNQMIIKAIDNNCTSGISNIEIKSMRGIIIKSSRASDNQYSTRRSRSEAKQQTSQRVFEQRFKIKDINHNHVKEQNQSDKATSRGYGGGCTQDNIKSKVHTETQRLD